MKRNALSLAASLALSLIALQAQAAPTASEADLAKKVDQLSTELDAVKAQLAQQSAVVNQPATVPSSYGEINYNRPSNAADAQADLRRFVLGFQHRFDSKTKVVAELEVEHAVSSSSDSGEVEVEQAFIEHQFNPSTSLRAGVFLMPVGLLNENHEPTAYYGVERNFVEQSIIPTTWREGGVQYVGTFDNGITAQAGLTTGFDLSKWDATSTEGAESPLGSIHQEMSLAKALDVAVFGAINWRGIPGLLLGRLGLAATPRKARLRLADGTRDPVGHGTCAGHRNAGTSRPSTAQGTISNTAALNAPLVGNPTLIPERFDGGYVQAAYKVWSEGEQSVSPFARVELYNTGRQLR